MSVAESELITSMFSEGQPSFLSARRVAEMLGIEQSEVAALVGSIGRALPATSEVQEHDAALRSLARILATAVEMTGEKSRAAVWFKHQSIPGWAGKTAYDLVGEGKADKVSDYLQSIQSGVYA